MTYRSKIQGTRAQTDRKNGIILVFLTACEVIKIYLKVDCHILYLHVLISGRSPKNTTKSYSFKNSIQEIK